MILHRAPLHTAATVWGRGEYVCAHCVQEAAWHA